MEFLLTQYIYPLEEPIQLSENLGFFLDNPRSELEISVIEDYILRAHESGYDYKFPPYSDEPIVTIENILIGFRDVFSDEDEYVAKVYEDFDRENPFNFLAKICVVVRFDDKGLGNELREEHRKMQENGEHGFFMLDEDHPLESDPKILADYCALLSLLVHSENEEYFGRQIVLDTNPLAPWFPVKRFWQEFLMFGMISQSHPKDDDSLSWTFFPYSREKIIQTTSILEPLLNTDSKDTLLYVGNLLKVASEHNLDLRTRILVLTSIIELLLTHNPNFNRFNVEDSISKQFQLKTSLLVYQNNKKQDIESIKQRLKIIYTQRSNIAHGNFKEFQKYTAKLEKNDEYVDTLVSDLYSYIRAIIEEYIQDPALIKFLKDS